MNAHRPPHKRRTGPGATRAAIGAEKRAPAGLSRGWEALFRKMRAIEVTAPERGHRLNDRATRALRYLEKRCNRPDLSS